MTSWPSSTRYCPNCQPCWNCTTTGLCRICFRILQINRKIGELESSSNLLRKCTNMIQYGLGLEFVAKDHSSNTSILWIHLWCTPSWWKFWVHRSSFPPKHLTWDRVATPIIYPESPESIIHSTSLKPASKGSYGWHSILCQFVCHINHCLFISIHIHARLSPTNMISPFWKKQTSFLFTHDHMGFLDASPEL